MCPPTTYVEPHRELNFVLVPRDKNNHSTYDTSSLLLTMTSINAANTPPPNIYIVGAQCTGKTSLTKWIAQLLEIKPTCRGSPIPKPQIVGEVAREVLRKGNFTANDITSSEERALELQRRIIIAQSRVEKKKTGWFISDRSALDALVYAQRYCSSDKSLRTMDELYDSLARLRNAVVILCEPVEAWLVDDGVRLMPENAADWLDLHHRFRENLAAFNVDFHILPRHILYLDDRARFVIELWEERAKAIKKQSVKDAEEQKNASFWRTLKSCVHKTKK